MPIGLESNAMRNSLTNDVQRLITDAFNDGLEYGLEIKETVSDHIESIIASTTRVAAENVVAAYKREMAEEAIFSVIFVGHGDEKIKCIKTIRDVTGMMLKEAKDFIEDTDAPQRIIRSGLNRLEADDIADKFKKIATVEIVRELLIT